MNEENILETETLETESVELEDTEIVENTEFTELEETVYETIDEIVQMVVDGLLWESEDAVADPQTEGQGLATASSLEVVDYATELEHINESLTMIVMILLFWFGAWMLRSWRTWTVKGGR